MHSDGRLWERVHLDELEVERPYPIVLRERKCTQSSIKGAPGFRDLALVNQELAVVEPDTRHLYVCVYVCVNVCMCVYVCV